MVSFSLSGVPGADVLTPLPPLPSFSESVSKLKPKAFSIGDAINSVGMTVGGSVGEKIGSIIGGESIFENDSNSESGGIYDTLSEFFLRSIVVITGFIFLAVGLTMFTLQSTNVQNTIKKVIKQ